jgi:NAD(P)-dependent dehydrogenase (short-subunit alcohol dehydrogenase family)
MERSVTETEDLAGRVGVVFGGGSGIGAATVTLLRSRGAEIVAADLSGGDVVCDVTDATSVDGVVAGLDRLDLAVNCAGVSGNYVPIAKLDPAEWRRTIDINLTGMFQCLRAELGVIASGGSIVNVSSGAGMRGMANLADYVASKHGVIGLTRAAALEVARRRIRVNVVCPGTIDTPMLLGFSGGDRDAMESMGRMSPIGRLGTADEVAETIAWLCSGASSLVTGAVIAVDGGVSAA